MDEYGINWDLKGEYGRTAAGVKGEDIKRGRKFHRVNVVAATVKSENGYQKIAAECYRGSMNGERFERWFEQCLLTKIKDGRTIIMDNASFHRKEKLKELCGNKYHILFLPTYSPDFNSIEKQWANMKRELYSSTTLESLLETAIYHYWH